MTADTRPRFNASVHGARGLFAMMVFVFHVSNSGLRGWLPADSWVAIHFVAALKFGVELFFGISGFVILGALRRAPSVGAFVWDRATRIYPLLWTTLIAITLVSVAVGHWLPPASDWLLNFLAPPPFFSLAQVNPAAWSLGYEVTFYIICAICWEQHRRGLDWRPVAVAATLIGVVLFPRAVLMPAGIAIASGMVPGAVSRTLGRLTMPALLLFLVGWRLVDLACGGNLMQFTPLAQPLVKWLTLVPLAAAAATCGAAALAAIVAESGGFAAWLRSPTLQWLGAISYSFYLWHPVVIAVVKAALARSGAGAASGAAAQALLALFSLPLALLVAHYSQRLVEVRLTRYLRRHGPRDDRGEAPVTAVALEPTGR